MQQLICPIDGKSCEKDCPDRYVDQPEGGCFLTTAQEFGAAFLNLGGGNIGVMFTPRCDCRDNEKTARGAANTTDGKVEQSLTDAVSASNDT